MRSKRFTLADLADAEQTISIFVADLRFAEQKKYLRLPALVINWSRKLRVEICGSYSSFLKSSPYSVLKGIIGTPLSVYKETVTLIFVYNTDSSYGAVLYKTKYQKLLSQCLDKDTNIAI